MIEDYLLEIEILQKKDTKTALDNGYTTKDSWHKFIIKQKQDEIAQAIINIAERYVLPIETVAQHFDSTMKSRVEKVQIQNITKTKAS